MGIHVHTLRVMENCKAISLKLPPDLLDKLEAYRKRQPHVPTRTQVIEDAIRALVEKGKR